MKTGERVIQSSNKDKRYGVEDIDIHFICQLQQNTLSLEYSRFYWLDSIDFAKDQPLAMDEPYFMRDLSLGLLD